MGAYSRLGAYQDGRLFEEGDNSRLGADANKYGTSTLISAFFKAVGVFLLHGFRI